MKLPAVYLIPCHLYDGVLQTIPAYVLDAVLSCQAFFVENERTARRYLKALSKSIEIDAYAWVNMKEVGSTELSQLEGLLKAGKTVGIISEAGCPGVADPGQLLVAKAQSMQVPVKPLVGPNSMLLALMASGFNGQRFHFHGYLPIDAAAKRQQLKALENETIKQGTTQIFIETPYRNDKLLGDLLETLHPDTWVCVAVDLTAPSEWIVSKKVKEWKKLPIPSLHKRPAIFLIGTV